MNEEDKDNIIAFSKVKVKDFVNAALDKQKAKKMKINYKRSVGITPVHLTKEATTKTQRKARREEIISQYLSQMTFASFLNKFEGKNHGLICLNKLLKKYRRKEGISDPLLRNKVSQVQAVLESDNSGRNQHKSLLQILLLFAEVFRREFRRVQLHHSSGCEEN